MADKRGKHGSNSSSEKVGAVLVVGGGIGGIQSALDLAESGYYVYLAEHSPAIGGVMAQLDKTFPTNDCSMCILSPKLVECGRHLNIETLTCTEVMDVEGEPGKFKVSLRKRARYIDPEKCTGCGDCAEVCPVRMPSEFDERLAERKAIFRPFAQAFPNVFTIDKRERPPCGLTCPAGTNIQGYVALIGEGKVKEALTLIKECVPLPGVIGRICPHPCEEVCKRGAVDEPLAICALKRFVADQVGEELPLPEITPREEKVAIIGSGPAGLSAAYYLALDGYQVTIFEALPVAGGMLYAGIPDYRLPREVLEREIEGVRRLGVEIRTNTRVGEDLTVDGFFDQGYNALFIAVGAHRSRSLGVPGEDADGVLQGLDFLRDLNLGREVPLGRRVAVIGGGNVAIDAARSALRLGAEEVTIVYRRSREEMPATDEEVAYAESEGVRIHYLATPVEILTTDGAAFASKRVNGIRCIRMRLGEPDSSGRRRPIPIEGSEFDLDVDTVIPAIGQAPDLSFLGSDSGIEVTGWGTIAADPVTLATSRPGAFAGGDAVTGPDIAIGAIAAGREAAVSIRRYLEGEDLSTGRSIRKPPVVDLSEVNLGQEKRPRQKMPTLSVAQRAGGFREVELGFTEEMAVREAQRCLSCGLCSECMQCVAACEAEAIDHTLEDEIAEIEVGAIILGPGFEEFDARLIHNYGYGRYPNVVTSTEFERILSASGPYEGHLARPSDRNGPRKIAWVQCVGSRDVSLGKGYCSSVCCMYAIKEAVIAKEHSEADLDTTIFFMDMRTYGKDFDKYYERAQQEHDIRFIRSKIYGVAEVDGTGDLAVQYTTEDGKVRSESFNLVVLSVGFGPSQESVKLAKRLGIHLNPYSFCGTDGFAPVETSRPGVFVCGAFSGPKDIPETVMGASAAAGSASVLLAPARKTLVREKTYPPERDVSGEEPRIGVFVCHCGINIGGVVHVPEVKDYAATLPNVVFADENLYTCSQDTQEKIKEMIAEHRLNRVVVASCSPRTHEPMFQETIREAGLNRYLFEMTNIRDQCSWVHMHEPEKATQKAKDLLRMAVAKARLIEPLRELSLDITRSALVIGGGVSGMTSALTLAEQGFQVHLVEREEQLGGMARRLQYTLEGKKVGSLLDRLIQQVSDHALIRVYTSATIVDVSGYIGNFTTGIMVERKPFIQEIKHGATIIATGAEEYRPTEYLYGRDPRVLTSLELEEEIAQGNEDVIGCEHLVMIQCVGSRDDQRPYCSRVCCSQSIKNALKLKALNPEMNITVLYRDIRTYGFQEDYYREARSQGVQFIRYDPDHKPKVETVRQEERYPLRVTVTDPILGEPLLIDADILALGVAIVPREEARELAQLYKVPVNAEGFFLEAHMKLRPVEFATDGVFLAGLAHSPKLLEESIAQAKAAASRATTVLVKDAVTAEGIVSSVNEEVCGGCGICEVLCPYSAITVDERERIAKINEALCKGCGTCASACPSGAIQQRGFKRAQISSMVDAYLEVA